MSVSEFFDYLLGRDGTHDLALQLAYVYANRWPRAERAGSGR